MRLTRKWEELAEKTGISPSTISDWKRKKTNPSADKLKIICDVLGISLYELLGEQDSRRVMDYVVVNRESRSEEHTSELQSQR